MELAKRFPRERGFWAIGGPLLFFCFYNSRLGDDRKAIHLGIFYRYVYMLVKHGKLEVIELARESTRHSTFKQLFFWRPRQQNQTA
jgi:hypothetical protein